MKTALILVLLVFGFYVGTWFGFDLGVQAASDCALKVSPDQVPFCAHKADVDAAKSMKAGAFGW